MIKQRGRLPGFKLSKSHKAKISKGRTGQRHTIETRLKISHTKHENSSSIMLTFIPFAIILISKAKGIGRNPIMVDIIRAFISSRRRYKPAEALIGIYAVAMRKSLEKFGYISLAAPNTVDRRVKYITPTPLFPGKGHTRQRNDIIALIISDVIELRRVEGIKRRAK
ncbi:hypothetical protein LCGC14_1305150 [marine sediment metagenome]|uniref:Uncharacterized protein n=1 Tax=marine sediment metagenome TaxID=412755 RepID=A0A0F9NRK9_9ZZZZ